MIDIYYLNFPDDKLSTKCLGKQCNILPIRLVLVRVSLLIALTVYGTYLFEAVQTCLSAADLFYWLVAF